MRDEEWHDLLHKLAEYVEEHEDGEHLILKSLLAGASIVEGESDEETLSQGISSFQGFDLSDSLLRDKETLSSRYTPVFASTAQILASRLPTAAP